MKKWLIVLLVSFGFLLFGCTKKESEVTTKKLMVKDFYTKEYIEAQTPKITMTQKTIRNDDSISGVNEFVLVFFNFAVYHFEKEEFIEFDKSSAKGVYLHQQYLRVDFTNKYLIFNYKTGEQLLELIKNPNFEYTFNENLIVVYEWIEGVRTETKRYYFEDHELLDGAPKKDPLESLYLGTFKDYRYFHNSDGITLFKDNKFYDYYAFEPSMRNWNFLENGNILILYINELPSESLEYDISEGTLKYNYHYVLYNTAKKKANRVELDILINYIQPKSEYNPIKMDNYIGYQKIDKQNKMIVHGRTYYGGISNDLSKLYPLEFDFGVPRYINPLDNELFAVHTEYGIVLIDGKNKVINQLTFNEDEYDVTVYGNATVMLREANEAFIYNLKTGELIKGGDLGFAYLSYKKFLLRDDKDKYYIFDGEFKELNGQTFPFRNQFYKVKDGTSFNYYFIDGTLLFNTNREVFYKEVYCGDYTAYILYYMDENAKLIFEIIKVSVDWDYAT
ncbi:MAG: hypothetical protein ACOX02_06355 [Acholeplasmatales bacterium]